MMDDSKNLQHFYHEQNLQIRKSIRQIDMQFQEETQNAKSSATSKQQFALKQQINFMVIGPPKSGKSSLLKYLSHHLRTMYFALNSNFNPEITFSELPGTVIKRLDIKKNKKYQIEGLSKMKETDQKKTISAIQFQDKPNLQPGKQLTAEEKSSKTFQKYSNALQLVDSRVFGCFKTTSVSHNGLFSSNQSIQATSPFLSIRTVLIVLNISTKIQFDQISCMKFFLADVRQKGIKTLIILTHIDRLNHLNQKQKLTLIEERIDMLSKQLDIKDRDDFICVQNYHEHIESSMTGTNSGQSGKYLSAENRSMINFQNPKNYQKIYQQKPFRQQNANNFQYKKVSESFISDASLQMEIPIISKHQKPYETYQQQNFSTIQQNYMNVSRSISSNPTQDNRYAKVSAKNISSQNNIPQNLEQKCMAKKNQSINYKPINQNSQQSMSQQSQISNVKNSQEINYYSLKLLMKILKESQKYVNRELKHKKIIKWFCG